MVCGWQDMGPDMGLGGFDPDCTEAPNLAIPISGRAAHLRNAADGTAGNKIYLCQVSSASSSSLRGATQSAAAVVASFFQKGARDFR